MNSKNKNNTRSLRAAIRTASRAARRAAFRKDLPVAVSRNGRIIFVYKNKKEVSPASLSTKK